MEVLSLMRLFLILLGFMILNFMVATSHRHTEHIGKDCLDLLPSTHEFGIRNNRMKTLYRSEHLVTFCVLFLWCILSLRVGEQFKSATDLRQYDLIGLCGGGKNIEYCSNESKHRSRFSDITEDGIYRKSSNPFDHKEDLYQQLFFLRRNTKQKVWGFPASLGRYFHTLETSAVKSELMKFEWARYETFKTFPVDSPAMPIRLASNGFYYNGVGDSVSCFSCRLQHRGWKDTDIVSDIHIRFSPNCHFVRGLDSTNIGIHSDEVEGAQGGTNYESHNPGNEELYIQRHCRQSKENESFTTTSRRQHKYPDYESYQHRMDTFTEWPYPEVIEPCVLADAGFFFAGLSDCVRCFSCGGGLRNWEYGDGPWGEHAKWFPWCTFLNERKGQDFIRQYADGETHSADEQTAYSTDAFPEQKALYTASAKGGEECKKGNNEDKTEMTISNDTENESRTETFPARKSRTWTHLVGTLCEMGFSETAVQNILLEKHLQESEDIPDSTLSALLDELFVKSEASTQDTRKEHVEQVEPIASTTSNNSESTRLTKTDELVLQTTQQAKKYSADTTSDPEILTEENLRYKNLLTCKICMENDSDVVFIPCGHMVSCQACAQNIRKCAICRQIIKGRVKAFMG